jgi:hypothetical protein
VNKAPANAIESQNSAQLPRVVTPAARSAVPPRAPARAPNLSPRNLSQGDLLDMGSANHDMASGNTNVPMMNTVLHPAMGKQIQYKDLMKHSTLGPLYKKGLGNEIGRHCQGIRGIQGTNTCFFVELNNIPKDRKITYGKLLCDYKPNKAEKEWVRLTVGSDGLDYTGDMATSTEDITTFKILINSTLSIEDAEMMMMGIKNCYLGTPLSRYEYMRLPLSIIPDDNIAKYNFQAISVAGWVYIEILKGMYGLKQAGLLANQSITTKIRTLWVLTFTTDTWLVVTQNKVNCIHTCCG